MYSGYEKNNIYGMAFEEIQEITPYYERSIHTIDQKPWLGQIGERSYMNNLKRELYPTKTYKELITMPIDANAYELIEHYEQIGNYDGLSDDYNKPILKQVETYSPMQNVWFKVIFIIFIMSIFYLLIIELYP